MPLKKTKLLPIISIGLLSLTSCGKAVNINTYDFKKDYGKIKLSKTHEPDVAIENAREIVSAYQADTKFTAKLIRYYYPTNTDIKTPLSCLEANITFVSTSFYIEVVQTRALGDGMELATPDQFTVYSDGTNTYRRISNDENSSWNDISSFTSVYKNMAKPTIYTYTTSSARVRGGKLGKTYFYEHYLSSQDQQARIITDKEQNLRFYYDRVMSNSYFDAYEFFLTDDEASITKPEI